jgi:hypothetical protein
VATCRDCGLPIEYSPAYDAWRVISAGGPATFCRPSPHGLHFPARDYSNHQTEEEWPMATGPEHYREAERLIKQANSIMDGFPSDQYAQTIAEAQVHATLANAAATAMSHWNEASFPMPQADRVAWEQAASERPGAQRRQREAEAAERAEFAAAAEADVDEHGVPWADRCTTEDPCPVRALDGPGACDH